MESVGTVTITNHKFEELVKDSVRISILKDYICGSTYVSTVDVKRILNIEESEVAPE